MIIHSLLDTDLYKLTMMQAVLHRFPSAVVEYRLICRSESVDLMPFFDEIQTDINHLCELRFQEEELNYLKQFSFFKDDFVEFLRVFQLTNRYVSLTSDKDGFHLTIKGPWLHTILFEVPLLAIISERYYQHAYPDLDRSIAEQRLSDKIALLNHSDRSGFKFSDFGTRRRFSKTWQQHVLSRLIAEAGCYLAGTSNVYFAKLFNIKPIGTMAHEFIQACQALGPRLLYSQQFAFESWAQEYRGDLGIALTDTYSTEAFLRDFDLYFCKLFDGVRHDSGDPFEWAEKIIQHYRTMRIEPKTKLLVFSDSLNLPLAFQLWDRFSDQTQLAFGIGTNLMNDMAFKPLDIVIKMVECNGQAVAKISNNPAKIACFDASYLNYLKQVFQIS